MQSGCPVLYVAACLSCVLYCCRAVCVWSFIISADCVYSMCEMLSVDRTRSVLFDLVALMCYCVSIEDADSLLVIMMMMMMMMMTVTMII